MKTLALISVVLFLGILSFGGFSNSKTTSVQTATASAETKVVPQNDQRIRRLHEDARRALYMHFPVSANDRERTEVLVTVAIGENTSSLTVCYQLPPTINAGGAEKHDPVCSQPVAVASTDPTYDELSGANKQAIAVLLLDLK